MGARIELDFLIEIIFYSRVLPPSHYSLGTILVSESLLYVNHPFFKASEKKESATVISIFAIMILANKK